MKTTTHASRRLLALAGAAAAFLGLGLALPGMLSAQTSAANAIANATIQPAGPRSGSNGTNFFNVQGSNLNANADFGVLDFSTSSLNPGGQTATGVQGNTLTLTLTESDTNFTAPGTLEFYLTTVTGTSIIAPASPLKYNGTRAGDGSTPTYGIDTGLGTPGGNASGSLYDLGSFSFATTGNTNTGGRDTCTLTLGTALNPFLAELNTSSGNVRLVVASITTTGVATFYGYGSGINTTPILSFTPTFGATVAPEPSTWATLVLGVAGLSVAALRRRTTRGA